MRSNRGIFLYQKKYVIDLLAEIGSQVLNLVMHQLMPNLQLTIGDGDLFEDPEKNRRLVGKLNYLTTTQPNITNSVSIVSQFMSSPTITYWEILRFSVI